MPGAPSSFLLLVLLKNPICKKNAQTVHRESGIFKWFHSPLELKIAQKPWPRPATHSSRMRVPSVTERSFQFQELLGVH